MPKKIAILFLIRSLEAGGAERQLIELCRALDKSQFSVSVITFYSGGFLSSEMSRLSGVELYSADKKSRWDSFSFYWRLWKLIKKVQPDVIHGYMSIANELSLILGIFNKCKVVWGVRCSYLDFQRYPFSVRATYKIGALLSRWADLIIANSNAGSLFFKSMGYPQKLITVIPNGVDTNRFKPNPHHKIAIRTELKLPSDRIVVGMAGRYDPMKGHEVFLRAAELAFAKRPDLFFVCVGGNPSGNAEQNFAERVAKSLAANAILVLGQRKNVEDVYCAFDICTSASLFGEGFSNTLAEGMSCGVPAVASNVGDASIIIGDTGIIVPPNDPAALASAWITMADKDLVLEGIRARARIVETFSLDALARNTSAAIRALL